MPRPPLDVGTWGAITTIWVLDKQRWRVRTRVRDLLGKRRDVTRYAASAAAAERALKRALTERRNTGPAELTGDTTVATLMTTWLDEIHDADLAITTKRQYAEIAATTIAPALGKLRIRELRVSRCDAALRAINTRHGYSVAKTARSVHHPHAGRPNGNLDVRQAGRPRLAL